MDDIVAAFRAYLLIPTATLHRFYKEVDETLKQFPTMDANTLLSALIDQDMRNHLTKSEVWEVMPRFEKGWAILKNRYRVNLG